jgi:alpha-methylacyl-CoA racemase
VAQYPHNQVRNNFVEVSGQLQPAPAPKFDLTPSEAGKVAKKGEYTEAIITELGLSVEQLKADGVI